ncbi:glutamine synthetase III [Pseudobacteriovorax antillogorgiicola]|uniref:Glutamine synthetase n=1 Tax=Pseudobacteriovorax antillogorgiicola TaxID=1513793 RepID=A0A1Y6BS98_9BACT|nr:glutamine synthetase III [Pseudobacteriovorax antillogorgiicola]TCS53747.1 glutamine synthetase [Pseudobacteriovorax antillogorgiicola]SMF22629.1 glutamine synthetase [Pseudobacteriovorax antillogorgiicola]
MGTKTRANARYEAIAKMSSRKIRTFNRPEASNGAVMSIPQYFGCNTFGWDLMSQRLPKDDVQELREVSPSRRKLTPELADKVAYAVKEWAIAKGATHYCHWFQPQTGGTAEKHDAFFSFDKSGGAIDHFTGNELMQQEPDASSFPSGGRRSTFEARGYTAWDATSPMFLMETDNGFTLCIPSIFISYSGEHLDEKTPLLRSITTVSDHAKESLELLGEQNFSHVVSNCGPEQEYFVIDRALYELRPDLVLAGRTVLGAMPPKHQQLSDHYFGSIKQRVVNFMMECEHELYKLGVPCKTRHNEVAPSQCESAPIYEFANIAADHNQLTMEIIRQVAKRHDLVALFHEKPYAGMNGSGKHLNWSLATNTGTNLLDPGDKPHENIRFLYFLTATIKAVHDWSKLLRLSVASAGNDFRLGANEAPPAIMSVFLGQTLSSILEQLGSGEDPTPSETEINLDIARIPVIAKDNTDRNRTSPFAFTGNKFEFRALGSSQSISSPIAYLNTAMAQALKEMNDSLRSIAGGNKPSEKQILEVISKTYKSCKAVCFEGDGYSEEWHQEAESRGLPNLKNTPEALQTLLDEKTRKLLIDHEIFGSGEELDARYNVLIERYNMLKMIEFQSLENLVATHVIPSLSQYLGDVAGSYKSVTDVLGDGATKSQKRDLENLNELLQSMSDSHRQLSDFIHSSAETDDEGKLGDDISNKGLEIAQKLEELSAQAEEKIDDMLWTLPKYREMIFSL